MILDDEDILCALDAKWNLINRKAKVVVGEKMIVCGRASRWWDGEIKDKISLRREVFDE